MSETSFVKQHILVEPLFNQWYAWSIVMAPATAAMCVANHHVKVMQSFVNAAQLHVSAVKNPAMLGGPFVNYDESKVPMVKELLDWTLETQGHLIRFAEAVKELEELLLNEATGFSLEPLYERIPEPLRGYVELVYDLHNRPMVRFLEGLLYRSPYYSRSSQSIALSAVSQDERPFVLSTPRLDDEKTIRLPIAFDHPGIDKLVRMKARPGTFAQLKEALEVPDRHDNLLRSFLTPESPRPAERYDGDGVRVRYLGHACVLIETRDVSILTDPFISYEYPTPLPRTTFADLPDRIDYVLLTHAHSDHTALETLLQLRHKTEHIVVPRNGGGALQDPSLRLMLKHAGFNQVVEIDEMDELPFKGGAVTGIPFFGEHGDLAIRTKLVYHVRALDRGILCVSDSNNFAPEVYEHVHRLLGDVDIVYLGMECAGAPMSWLYAPLLTRPIQRRMDQTRRLDGSNYEKGIRLVNTFHPKQVYVYAMGQEPWTNHVMALVYDENSPQIIESDKLVADCLSRGIPSERLFIRKDVYI